jgi:hypothetical protein
VVITQYEFYLTTITTKALLNMLEHGAVLSTMMKYYGLPGSSPDPPETVQKTPGNVMCFVNKLPPAPCNV